MNIALLSRISHAVLAAAISAAAVFVFIFFGSTDGFKLKGALLTKETSFIDPVEGNGFVVSCKVSWLMRHAKEEQQFIFTLDGKKGNENYDGTVMVSMNPKTESVNLRAASGMLGTERLAKLCFEKVGNK